MPDGIAEQLRVGFDAWRRGDNESFVATLHPDIEWDISAHPLPDFPDTGRGRTEWLHHFATYLTGWNDYDAEIRDTTTIGEEVIAITHERTRLGDSETYLERDLPMVWTIRDGLAVRFRVFKTREQAIAAVSERVESPAHDHHDDERPSRLRDRGGPG